MNTKEVAVVFVTDKGYLVPSIIAALQVAQQSKVVEIADIFILMVGVEASLHTRLEESFSGQHLNFLALEPDTFMPDKGTWFNQTHISYTTLGRFAICKVIPETYKNIVYIDGDVQIMGDVFPLINHKVKDGYIAAGSEHIWLCENDSGDFWPKHKSYLNNLGIFDYRSYFNAGVLAFRWTTWNEMAPKALAFFNENSKLCLYHDQSALNATFTNKREELSPAYNFITFFADLNINDEVKPVIAHFTGGNKPWYYPGKPWDGQFINKYNDFLTKYPFLNSYLRREDETEILKSLQRAQKLTFKSVLVTPWRQFLRRRKFRKFLRQTRFAF